MNQLRGLLESATARLKTAGIESARWDAERLISHQLRRSRLSLYTHPELSISALDESAIDHTVRRRCSREPLQYLIGFQEFWGLRFKINSDVLIPRPESELLIEAALASRESILRQSHPLAVDIGTGSGCLAISLLIEMPQLRVYATDISPKALSIAEENAAFHGLSGCIRFLAGDLYEPLIREGLKGQIGLLISNPPYIHRNALGNLPPEIRENEPRVALDGGEDGLEFYKRLLPQALQILAPGGRMILELGLNQADDIKQLASTSGLQVERIVEDLAGIPRVIELATP